eukprot:71347-Pleurochrysis_carterae.AAC.2
MRAGSDSRHHCRACPTAAPALLHEDPIRMRSHVHVHVPIPSRFGLLWSLKVKPQLHHLGLNTSGRGKPSGSLGV